MFFVTHLADLPNSKSSAVQTTMWIRVTPSTPGWEGKRPASVSSSKARATW